MGIEALTMNLKFKEDTWMVWDLLFRHPLSELKSITLSHVGISLVALLLSLTGVQIEIASGGNLKAIKKNNLYKGYSFAE